jgi:hypothetical protein
MRNLAAACPKVNAREGERLAVSHQFFICHSRSLHPLSGKVAASLNTEFDERGESTQPNEPSSSILMNKTCFRFATRTNDALIKRAVFPSIAAMTLAVLLASGDSRVAAEECSACKEAARLARQAALAEAQADYLLGVAKASNLPTDERKEARKEAMEALEESRQDVKDQYEARVDLCEALDECRYNPVIDPANFLTPAQIAVNPNPYLPLAPGILRRYRSMGADDQEIVEVRVTHETREILGVTCIVVADTVWEDGALKEDTRDWFAQDKDGNVWYFGERSVEYEDGEIAGLEGSWEAGVDGAQPGIIMKANPQVGDVYRQEYALGEAEDAAGVVALGETVTVPYGSFNNCLKTGEFTPLEPDAAEDKYYAPGVGLVLEAKPETGARVELIAVETTP